MAAVITTGAASGVATTCIVAVPVSLTLPVRCFLLRGVCAACAVCGVCVCVRRLCVCAATVCVSVCLCVRFSSVSSCACTRLLVSAGVFSFSLPLSLFCRPLMVLHRSFWIVFSSFRPVFMFRVVFPFDFRFCRHDAGSSSENDGRTLSDSKSIRWTPDRECLLTVDGQTDRNCVLFGSRWRQSSGMCSQVGAIRSQPDADVTRLFSSRNDWWEVQRMKQIEFDRHSSLSFVVSGMFVIASSICSVRFLTKIPSETDITVECSRRTPIGCPINDTAILADRRVGADKARFLGLTHRRRQRRHRRHHTIP